MTAQQLRDIYIKFFKGKGHKEIPNSPIIPENDPTTLFTSSGMQPLVPYLLGKPHPQGKRLVNVQNCFRAQDIDEVGDNRHTTFFRMLGNWSLGDYFKKEQLSWFFEFLIKELHIPADRLYVSVFEGWNNIPRDEESANILHEIFENAGLDPNERIFYYGTKKNWWSRAGEPEDMPVGELGGPDSEVFFDFGTPHNPEYGQTCHPNCECGRYLEIGNSVFMQYVKTQDGSFTPLPQKNVDFGGGFERILAALQNQPDIFQTTLFAPIIESIEKASGHDYIARPQAMRAATSHFISACFIAAVDVTPTNTGQGYILRRLIRRGVDALGQIGNPQLPALLETIVKQHEDTDPLLADQFETIKYVILKEEQSYRSILKNARETVLKKYPGGHIGDELKGQIEISTEDAFSLYQSHGLSPIQIKSLGFTFKEEEFSEKMKEHQEKSRKNAKEKFARKIS